MLASGSEDKTCRIWDLRTNRVHKALAGFESSVTTTSFTPADSHTIYVGSGDKIHTFDLRMESLLLNTTQATKMYDGAKSTRATYLAACDDAGDVRVLDLKTHRWMRQLQRKHDNVALSGGMDKLVVAWDFYKGRAMQLIDTDNPQPDGAQSKQLFNPPFVHSIAMHPSGTRVAIGLGDGSIQFLHNAADPPTAPSTSLDDNSSSSTTPVPPGASKKNKKKKGSVGSSSSGKGAEDWLVGGRLVDAHTTPIATIEYAGFNPGWLVTSASNGSIAIWEDQASRYESAQQQQKIQDMLKQHQQQQQVQLETPSLPYGRPLQPLVEFKTTDVFERLNCISTSQSAQVGESQVFVAGTHARIGEKKLQGRIAVYRV
ncbi:WD repeat-containing protein 53 [Dissophora ornata]|nr:WD repeat-containing protein 53 [Dissophora ornata]